MALNSTVGEGLVEEVKSINADYLLIRGSRNRTNKYELSDVISNNGYYFLYEHHARQTWFIFIFFLELELLKESPSIALSMHMMGVQWSQLGDVQRQIKMPIQTQHVFKVIQFSETK